MDSGLNLHGMTKLSGRLRYCILMSSLELAEKSSTEIKLVSQNI